MTADSEILTSTLHYILPTKLTQVYIFLLDHIVFIPKQAVRMVVCQHTKEFDSLWLNFSDWLNVTSQSEQLNKFVCTDAAEGKTSLLLEYTNLIYDVNGTQIKISSTQQWHGM